MEHSSLDRRSFHKLTMAALGGAVAGTAGASNLFAADEEKKKEGKKKPKKEIHVCRGLNSCKGHDVFSKSACAGQGACATAEYHLCAGKNACKNQGGCGEQPGVNKCKGMGKCAVPLSDDGWKAARASFEARMKKADKKYGDAPPKDETPHGNKKLLEKVKKQRAARAKKKEKKGA